MVALLYNYKGSFILINYIAGGGLIAIGREYRTPRFKRSMFT